MARKLPWLAPDGTEKTLKATKARSKRKKSDDDDEDTDISISKPLRKAKGKQRLRNPSSSPPPVAPKEELMINGLEHDDGWVMVEDEFLTTAKLYTAHLHHADYQRLKNLSRVRAVSTLSGIERPTDGRTKQTTLTKKMIQAGALRKGTDAAITNLGLPAEVNEDEDDDPYMQDPQLAGLMNQTQLKESVKLSMVVRSSQDRSKPNIKRSKPIAPTSGNETEETDDEDLDRDCLPKATSKRTLKVSPIAPSRKFISNPSSASLADSSNRYISSRWSHDRETSSKSELPTLTEKAANQPSTDDECSVPPKRRPVPSKIMQRMNRRLEESKAAKAAKQEDEEKPSLSTIQDVPMWLL